MKYIDAEKLKAEIEKRMHICDGVFERDSDTYYQGKAVAYQETLSLIDSLQQEKPSGDLEEAAIDFADNARKALYSKDYAISSIADYDHGCIDGFKAGAEWQKEQMIKEMFAEQGTTEEEYLDKSMAQVREIYKKLGITMAKEDEK